MTQFWEYKGVWVDFYDMKSQRKALYLPTEKKWVLYTGLRKAPVRTVGLDRALKFIVTGNYLS